jgi:branched-subunit amino acid aminotransferase/4-amino-4-deoxychorismate lyase
VTDPPPPHIEINGRPATPGRLAAKALIHYGHFTAMQVRSGRVRGLDLHLARLDGANREMFGHGLPGARVRGYLWHALAGRPGGDAAVRICVYQETRADPGTVLVSVAPPVPPPPGPVSLHCVPYQRSLPHLKHLGDFGQAYHIAAAARAGFDDALLTGAGGEVSEGAMANIGFFDGEQIVWPLAPALAGTAMQALAPRLAAAGLPARRAPVRVAELGSFAGAFVISSRGIAPVCRVDDLALPVPDGVMRRLGEIYRSVPWDPVPVGEDPPFGPPDDYVR